MATRSALCGCGWLSCGRLVEARAGAPAKLLRAESRDIDEKKPVRDGRSRLDWFLDLDRFFDWRGFKFHNGLGYKNLRRLRNMGLGIGDWALGRDSGLTNPESLIPNPVNVAAFRQRRSP